MAIVISAAGILGAPFLKPAMLQANGDPLAGSAPGAQQMQPAVAVAGGGRRDGRARAAAGGGSTSSPCPAHCVAW